MRITLTSAACCLTGLFLVNPVAAQVKRDLDSHQHGASSLNIVIENSTVYLEFESPWNNLVGFEHEPSTDEQREAVSQAISLLEQPLSLFSPDGDSACVVASIDIESTMSAEGSHSDHDHGDEHDDEHGHDDKHAEHDDEHGHDDEHAKHDDEHGHDDEHAKHDDEHGHDDEHAKHDDEHGHDDEHASHDDEHGHDDEHAHHGSDTHSEVLVQYSYECESISNLASIDVQLFQHWSGIEQLEVQMAGPSGQSAIEINASQTVIDLATIR